MGLIGSVFILIVGMSYLLLRRKAAQKAGEGYGEELSNEPEYAAAGPLPHPLLALLALLPLIAVGVLNKVFTVLIPKYFGAKAVVNLAGHALTVDVAPLVAIWAVEGALLIGILLVIATSFKEVSARLAEGSKAAVGGALLASMTTVSAKPTRCAPCAATWRRNSASR
jgi:H+/gluconate symporter-like permease